MPTTMNDVVSLAKRRGFIFPGSEIYGGLANTYDFGPLGVELLRNILNHWWKYFVTHRSDMFGLDSSILMSPKVWEASGHTASFTDALIDCKTCRTRTRADHLIEDFTEKHGKEEKVEGKSPEELTALVADYQIPCPTCGGHDWTDVRSFNLLFETNVGIVEESQSLAYLRGEIAQGMFVNFKNVLNTMRPKLPFGIAQSGKAFRNEITLGNFVFRTLEFNLAEFEYFFDSEKQSWEELFEVWKKTMQEFAESLGLESKNLRWRTHSDEERSHYSTRTEDLDFQFPFGFKEMFGLAYRTDYDLRNHMEKSGVDLRYTDPYDPQHKFIPHVIEPTFGINRIFLAVLAQNLITEGERTYLKLPAKLAPYKVAIFPLVKNKPELVDKAQEIFQSLQKIAPAVWDDRGNIGKRYVTQDEIGTPFCVTVDYQTLEDGTVTLRDRDTTKQERLSLAEVEQRVQSMLS
ncbi:MAG: glycine--tRNA ligase [Candidatus Pacebacteria bacterium CG10_big_fil_rev_8_21_14_0_10_36_11]|nr:glycine--tRNA ligase [Candidatus Pacearchaeota archaeon]OIP74581.1 MAG: glycine--tRNA ligase [Candidatus Pacebacteria bacterium CG2_30_36_39]PIR65208.1 MAG: glycine--tRNA ligase [Candidatus Pacebacteria bacterium CG10_big_fil_rev_8_21_14_0_10_36_11]PJC42950.1 MAG: glycine--tRNA ligase [Candidatus Pacebacteria bacterium CG_4_9_14_0_2_um_filter_36_8]